MPSVTHATLRAFLEKHVPTLKTGEYELTFKLRSDHDLDRFCVWLRELETSIQQTNNTIEKLDLMYAWCYNTIYMNIHRVGNGNKNENENENENEKDVIGTSDLVIKAEGTL
jgi:hypothetical protein